MLAIAAVSVISKTRHEVDQASVTICVITARNQRRRSIAPTSVHVEDERRPARACSSMSATAGTTQASIAWIIPNRSAA
jgi:hypothetical protein